MVPLVSPAHQDGADGNVRHADAEARPSPNTLPKSERLSGKKAIGRLMEEGKWGRYGVLKYCCLPCNGESHGRVMVSVPKRLFKRAVKRNLLKRRLRESYRTQKGILASRDVNADVLLQYNSPEILPYAQIREAVAGILTEIAERAMRTRDAGATPTIQP